MNSEQSKLLSNVFDSLDRLFDRQSSVLDLYELMFATDIALGSVVSVNLKPYANELERIVKSNVELDVQRELALQVTDALRHELSELFPL